MTGSASGPHITVHDTVMAAAAASQFLIFRYDCTTERNLIVCEVGSVLVYFNNHDLNQTTFDG